MEKCLTNIELVTNICKFLTYDQQLQLLKVSKELEDIIVNFIWKSKLKEIQILYFENTTDNLVSDRIDLQDSDLQNDIDEYSEILQKNRFILKSQQMKNFLNLNAENIRKLQLIAMKDEKMFTVKVPLIHKLKNLIYLCYWRITLTNEDLKNLADNCLNLETLVLYNCLNREGLPLLPDRDIDVGVIKTMLNLKNLIIMDYNIGFERLYNFTNVKHILSQLKLHCLNINVKICSDNLPEKVNYYNYANLKYCKMLRIGRFVKSSDYTQFQTDILPNFENLRNLYIRGLKSVIMNKKFFNILIKSCEYLTHLTMSNCRIEEFEAPPNLQELSLLECRGMSSTNLRTILEKMHLKSFTSEDTAYEGELKKFLISSTLQKFKCDFTSKKLLGLLKFNHQNLKYLTHFHWCTYSFEKYSLNLSNFAPNLKVLSIQQLNLNMEECFKLKFLEKICITSHYEILSSEILQLLKHEYLRDLSIDYVTICKVDVNLNELAAFKTNLNNLSIPSKVMESMTDFYLDLLLDVNRKLILTCFNITADLVSNLLNNFKFPHRFSSINICGFSIDCLQIRQNHEETINLIKLIINLLRNFNKCYVRLE